MSFFFYKHFENVIKYDLINKFNFKNIKSLPKLNKIVLNFNCQPDNFQELLRCLIAVEFITLQQSILTYSKISNVSLKIRKGQPIGCKVTLRKNKLYCFLTLLVTKIIPNVLNFKIIKIKNSKFLNNSISFKIKKNLFLPELESHYLLFKNLPFMQITLIANTETLEELIYLIRSFNFPIKN